MRWRSSFKKKLRKTYVAEKRVYIRDHRPLASPSSGVRADELSRSTFYAEPRKMPSDAELVADPRHNRRVRVLRYRRVAPSSAIAALSSTPRRSAADARARPQPAENTRFTRTTDSDHDGPIFPNVANDFDVHGAEQLWVADITYIAISTSFVYVAVILDAFRDASSATPSAEASTRATPSQRSSRRSRCGSRCPAASPHRSRSQYASEKHRAQLEKHGLIGSMSRRGNPYDNPRPRAS